jgi:hypothetical protein
MPIYVVDHIIVCTIVTTIILRKSTTVVMSTSMISIVYGSLVAGLPNNRAALSAAMADICAQYLRTGSTNSLPSPFPFSRVTLK